MVKVKFYRDGFGYQAMDLDGHAEYNPGNDVVCAGISALAFALAGELRQRDVSFIRFDIKNGVHVEIEPFIEDTDRLITDTIFQTVLTGLRQIEKKYPENIEVSEVVV